ncbi:MAG: hypothetical protein K2X66_08500 [Cyanobacteria bacterium]|nr:hypothetical protein [Cyanobacteriota bacterium]
MINAAGPLFTSTLTLGGTSPVFRPTPSQTGMYQDLVTKNLDAALLNVKEALNGNRDESQQKYAQISKVLASIYLLNQVFQGVTTQPKSGFTPPESLRFNTVG